MIKPMLARLEPRPFTDPEFIWEEKFDGARLLALVNGNGTQLQARSGTNKTNLFPDLNIQTKKPVILDGEVTCEGAGFRGIQHRINRGSGVAQAAKIYPAVYQVFDILEVAGINLRDVPLLQRKEILQNVVIPNETTVVVPWSGDGEVLFDQMIANGKEGVIGKPLASAYVENNRGLWIKAKCNQTDTFTVCGFTQGTGWRKDTFGALLLGKPMDGKLVYVGSVGTGFTCKKIAELMVWLKANIVLTSPFGYNPETKPVTWVNPTLQVKVRFLEFTEDGQLRFPAYLEG